MGLMPKKSRFAYFPRHRGKGGFVGVPPERGGVTVDSIPRGSLALTGYAPSVLSSGQVIAIPSGSLTLTGNAPTVLAPRTIAVPTKTLTLTGYAPTIVEEAFWDVTFTPPTLSSPTEIEVYPGFQALDDYPAVGDSPAGQVYYVSLNNSNDYIIRFTGTEPLEHPLLLVGGRNVRVIAPYIVLQTQTGGHIGDMPYDNQKPVIPAGQALALSQTHHSFVEGGLIDVNGHDCDAMVITNQGISHATARGQRDVTIQNTFVKGVEGTSAHLHGDFIQNQNVVVRNLQIENCSHRHSSQGIICEEYDVYNGAVNLRIRRWDSDMDSRLDEEEVQISIIASSDNLELEDVYVEDYRGSDWHGIWYNGAWRPAQSGGVYNNVFGGTPPGGQFAPENRVGPNYVSPH